MAFIPTPTRRRPVFKTGLLLSLAFHLTVIGLLFWMAARHGLFGLPVKQITISMVEPPPVDEPPPPAPKPPPEALRSSPTMPAEPVRASPPAPPTETTPPVLPQPQPAVAAPAPMEMPALVFDDGGKTVQTEKDPVALYRSFVEFSLRSRWNRPMDIADERFVALVELAVDAAGRLSDPRWKRKSGNPRWDASVLDAIVQTHQLDHRPPAGFPMRLTVRFDVVQSAELTIQNQNNP